MWEKGTVQGSIVFSAPQRGEKKYVFEYFSFGKSSIA
jgi:hypothetical protein